jgi:AcrR family transcriptional regulator
VASDTATATAKPQHEDGQDRMLRAALAVFMEKGYHGTSMRDIAQRAACSVSNAYHYFPSKRQILFRIVRDITVELAETLEDIAARPTDDPARRLADLVMAHVLLHTERQDESFVGNTELRSLAPDERTDVVKHRDRISTVFKKAIAEGIRGGRFDCPTPADTARAIVSMATAVATWYRPNGPLSPAEIGERYAALALRMVGTRG